MARTRSSTTGRGCTTTQVTRRRATRTATASEASGTSPSPEQPIRLSAPDSTAGYELLDVGDRRRLERFGDRVVDRPAPGATGDRRDPGAWASADARFDRVRDEWSHTVDPWVVEIAGLRLELRMANGGQVGLFPDHLGLLGWLRDRVGDVSNVLNLFAYTGLVTLALARAGASVAHV